MTKLPNQTLKPEVLNQAILAEQVSAVYKQNSNVVVGNALGAVIFSFALWDIYQQRTILMWLSAMLLILLGRFSLYLYYQKRSSNHLNNQSWMLIYTWASFFSGAGWGSTGFLFISSENILYGVFVALWVLAMSTGGLLAYAASLRVAYTFFGACLLPIIVSLVLTEQELYLWLSLGMFCYLIFAPRTMRPINKWMRQSIASNIELHESESRFKSLFNNSPDPSWIIDEKNQFTLCNRAAFKTLGYDSFTELIGKHPSELSPPKQPDGESSYEKAEAMMAIAHSQATHRFEWVHQQKNGKELQVEVTLSHMIEGGKKWLYCIWRDISARKASEELLRKLSQAVEQAGESVVITDIEGNIEYANPSFTRMTGYANAEVMGKHTRILKSGIQTPAYYKKLWDTISSGNVWTGAILDRRKDGSTYPAIMSISPILDENRVITHYVGIQQDMTEHNLLEEKFFQAQKMEAIGTLVGGIAHDFNNILAAITGNLYLAKARTKYDTDVHRMLDSVELLSFRAADLIKQLLTFARKDRVSMQPLPFTPFIKETFKLFRAALPESIDVQMQLCEELLNIKGDATQLHQVLMNLVNNARDAVQDKDMPTISIALEPVLADESMLKNFPILEVGRYAHLSVSDNGCGIPEGMLAQIFDPFFTTKEQGKGTGLGLAMVFGAIKTHGGFIDVNSVVGEGTTVHVFIPLLEDMGADLPQSSASTVLQGKGELILLVDDEPDILDVGKEILESLGYRVVVARDGLEAVEVYATQAGQIDLVMTDIVMPKLGGVKAVEQMKEINPEVIAVFTTGYDRHEAFPDLLSGTAFVLSKPYNVASLSKLIGECLKG